MLLDSPTLATNLKDYDEDYRFALNRSFNITIKGGNRAAGNNSLLTAAISTSILNSAAAGGYNPTAGYN